jgi:hypothetical protein
MEQRFKNFDQSITDLDRVQLLQMKELILIAQAKERQKTSTGGANPQLVPNLAQAEPLTPEETKQLAEAEAIIAAAMPAVKKFMGKEPTLAGRVRDQLASEAGKAAMVNLSELKKEPPVREQLAAEAGISGRTYTALKTVNEKGSDDLKDAVREKKILWSILSKRDKVDAVLARVKYLVTNNFLQVCSKIVNAPAALFKIVKNILTDRYGY